MRQPFPAAELGILAVEILVLHEEDIQCLGTGMRHQSQHDNDPFVERDFLSAGHAFQPFVSRWCDFLY